VFPAILEFDAGPGNEVFDSSRHEDFIWPCQTGDPRPDVNRDAGNIVTYSLDFTRVDSGTYLQAEDFYLVFDFLGTLDRSCRTVEGRQEPITRRVDYQSSKLRGVGDAGDLEHIQ
jgi:hypothetical protein